MDSTVRGVGKETLHHWRCTRQVYIISLDTHGRSTLHFPYNNNIHMHSYMYPTNRAIGESTKLHCTRLPSLQISEDYWCKITGN